MLAQVASAASNSEKASRAAAARNLVVHWHSWMHPTAPVVRARVIPLLVQAALLDQPPAVLGVRVRHPEAQTVAGHKVPVRLLVVLAALVHLSAPVGPERRPEARMAVANKVPERHRMEHKVPERLPAEHKVPEHHPMEPGGREHRVLGRFLPSARKARACRHPEVPKPVQRPSARAKKARASHHPEVAADHLVSRMAAVDHPEALASCMEREPLVLCW